MRYLGIDTSGAVAVALVTPGGPQVLTARDDEPRRHAERLAPMIEQLLSEAGADRTELAAVAVGTGPAPFTGLRAGLVTARVLGLALGVPVHGVPSLDAVAAAAARHGGLPDGTPVLVVTDARRREVYWARYEVRDGTVVTTHGPDVAAPADVPRHAGDVVVGSGVDLYPDVLGPADPALAGVTAHPDPALLVELALARAVAGRDLPADPLYLRRPDAVPPGASKRVLA